MKKIETKELIHITYGQNIGLERVNMLLRLLEAHLMENLEWKNPSLKGLKYCFNLIKRETKKMFQVSERLLEVVDIIKNEED